MDYKPNNHEHNSQTTTAGQPARAAASYHQIILTLIFVLIENLKNIFQQLKDDCMMCWFDLQNMVRGIINLMKIISPVGDDHNEGMKGEEFHIEKQNQKELEEDKENDINMVGQSSEHVSAQISNHPFCIENISNHVAAQIQQLKDDCVQFRLELQKVSDMMQNLMNRTSVIDQDHGEQKKTEEFHIEKQKEETEENSVNRTSVIDQDHGEHKKTEEFHIEKQKEEAKENNVKAVDQSTECFCGICLDFKAESDIFRGGKCNDLFCIDCISKHVASKIQQNNLEVKCPIPSCGVEIKPEYLMSILPKDVIDRWESAIYESSITLSQKFYCPFKNCSVLLVNDGKRGKPVTRCECPNCHRLFCAQCKIPWHAEMSCKEFQMLKKNKGENYLDMKFLESAKANKWPKCPNCSFYVQRKSGCEHMTCRCGCNFCYKCGGKWKFGHTCK
ncbi:PREDICTED: uncharacterized protein DDB_G0292642-like [Lupinus angustifolius]|uniref:uncharacterized protein DDB_G0292642-like n=1 Tax=Lupinus angustifolius TaxID=3871 RepID=UPI00092F3C9B|nr:PREDICTED: uncharacterized protein DDB_G0292642-like [Lupinus angustifolius]XP_019429959.1 PREDICTED: uncharacterized protein DDB_G0292642-like [Lupinus angustifolius]XP_019429960.1 PREDICTED: uncharacterized protein DDB_G0292642-like [Lupinus angustifolius]